MSGTLEMSAVEVGVRTDPGRDPDKQVNEDATAHEATALGILAIVCDGMGGHAGGKEASELAVKTIVERVKGVPEGTLPRDALKLAIEEANASVWGMPAIEAGFRPGSTVVAALIHSGGVDIAHVGDSRIYLVHAGAISQVTRDHSMVQEMVDRNLIRAEDAAKHPDANKILRALGIAKDVEVDVRAESIAYVAGDVLVLCSDGLSDLVGPPDILEIAGTQPPAQSAGQLVDLSNARGGHDNITALVIRFRTSSVARDPATIVKTVQLTQHSPEVPPDRGSGPKGTLLAGPLQAPAPAPPPVAAVAIPRPPPPPPSERGRSPALLIAGIALAVAGIALVGLILYFTTREVHHNPKVVDDGRDSGQHSPDDDDAGPDPEVAPAPPLSSHHHHHHPRHDASTEGVHAPVPTLAPTPTPPPTPQALPTTRLESPSCAKARAAKASGLPPAIVHKHENECRAAGGTP